MSEITEKLKRALEFDRDKDVAYDHENDLSYKYHARLKPYHDAILECISVLEIEAEETGYGADQIANLQKLLETKG